VLSIFCSSYSLEMSVTDASYILESKDYSIDCV
jgi:hypothetical protein